MKIFLQTIILALAQFSSLTYATTMQSQFYAGAELGLPLGSEQATSFSQGLISRLGGTATTTESGSVQIGKIFGGYKAQENIGIEIGIFQSTKSTLQFTGTSILSYSGTAHNSVYGLNYSTLLRPNIASGWNHVFFRLGGHWTRLEATSTIIGFRSPISTSTINTGSGILYGLGYEGTLDKNIDWRVQFTRSNSVAGISRNNTSVISFGILKNF